MLAASGRRRSAALIGSGLASIALLAGCSAEDAIALGWPRGVTPQAERMYDLWIGSVVAALAVGVFVWGLIFWCVIRYRKRGDELPPQTRYNLPIEILYSVVPFLIVSVLFYYTAIIQADVMRTRPNPDVTVEVVGFKWGWKFRYLDEALPSPAPGSAPAKDEKFVHTIGTSTYVPVLVLPTHKRIRFLVTGRDVIHSFWVPDLLFKRDALPGNYDNKFEVTISKEGAFVGRCAELCGDYHSQMNFELRAVTAAEYDAFIQAKKSGRSTPEALQSIGQPPYATTTRPFNTEPVRRPGESTEAVP